VGGDFSSNSEQTTSLEGSRISSGGNVNLKAGALDYRAAQDTTSTTGTQANAAASLQVNVNAEHVVGGELSVAGGGGSNQLRSSTAVVGGISSGGAMNINVKDDASFAGTSLSSKGDMNAGGKVNFAAANSTSQSSAVMPVLRSAPVAPPVVAWTTSKPTAWYRQLPITVSLTARAPARRLPRCKAAVPSRCVAVAT
jgi:hypothetical protein